MYEDRDADDTLSRSVGAGRKAGLRRTCGSFAGLALLGSVGGVAAGALDALFALPWTTAGARALSYGLALDALFGAALGFAAALSVCAGNRCGRRVATKCIPTATVASVLAVYLNLDLFDGPQISRHPQVGIMKAAFYPLMCLAIYGSCCWFSAVMRMGLRVRSLVAIAGVLCAATCTWAGLNLLNAYPLIKVQFALGSWGALTCAAALLRRRSWSDLRHHVGLLALFLCVATGAALFARQGVGIHRVRSLIVDTPLPATSKAIRPVEELLLDRLVPLPQIGVPSGWSLSAVGPVDPKLPELLDQAVPERRGLNVIWIAIDALRRDRVGCYGYGRPTTPNLDALATESVLFRRATTPTPASAMAYSSLMGGLFGRACPAYAAQYGTGESYAESPPIARVLADRGWRTMGLTSFFAGAMTMPVFACTGDGFQVFNPGKRGPALVAPQVTDRALAMVDEAQAAGGPFFLWVHYLDPHAPYEAVPGHAFGPRQVDAYDSEIAFSDAQVGRLLAGLKTRGLDEKTIIVLFSDHGEAFGEHNNRQHGGSLHYHQIDVPLMMRVPGLAPRTVDSWVGLSDLAPTTLSLLGVEDSGRRLGRDLSPLLLGADDGWVDVVYSERPGAPWEDPPSQERAVCAGDLKLIWNPRGHTYQVFNVRADPLELRNLFDPGDPQQRRLLRLMAAWDQRIDGPMVSGVSDVAAPRTLRQRFKDSVKAYEAAGPDGRDAILSALQEMVDSPEVAGLRRNRDVLGDSEVVRLQRALLERLPRMPDTGRERALAVELLGFTGDEQLVPVFQRELMRPTSRMVLSRLAVFLARHGDRSMLPKLRAAFPSASVMEQVSIAEALAYLGDDLGRGVLQGVLGAGWDQILRSGVRGLGAIGSRSPFHYALFSRERIWGRPRQLQLLLDLALAQQTPVANAVLARIALDGEATVAAAARDELVRRVGADVVRRLPVVGDAMAAARQGLEYGKYSLVVDAFESLTPEDDPLVGPSWWMLAQAGWETGDALARARGWKRLEAAVGPESPLRRLVERVKREPPPRPRPVGAPGLGARLIGPPVIPTRGPGDPFYAEVEVTNDSDAYISGGWWREGPMLGWSLSDENAGPEYAVPLPVEGLQPGERRVITIIGQLAKSPGPCTPRLVLVERPRSSPVATLLSLDPVTVE